MLDALVADPSLTLWSVCTASATGAGTELCTLGEVAQWLHSFGLHHALHWTNEDLSSQPQASPSDAARWAHLARISTEAMRAAEPPEKWADDQAPLVGMLSNAPQWLASCYVPLPAPSPSQDVFRSCLPDWLMHRLNELGQSAQAIDSARRAAADLADRQPEQPPNGLSVAGLSRRGPAGRHRQQQQLARLVPEIARRLARLDALESDFAHHLEQEKLAALKELAYGAGHEINNPLANISSRAQTLLRDETDPERRRWLATINSQAFRAHEMIADLMLFAHPPTPEVRPVDCKVLIDQVIRELQPIADSQQTAIGHSVDAPLPNLQGDAVHLQVAIKSICTNSLEALGMGGQVDVQAHADCLPDGSQAVAITIRDTGPGIAADVRRHMFDPFFSGREAGRGMGFGLSKAWRIVTDHGGQIEVQSDAAIGATLIVRLPVNALHC
jgi:hypothetical protein